MKAARAATYLLFLSGRFYALSLGWKLTSLARVIFDGSVSSEIGSLGLLASCAKHKSFGRPLVLSRGYCACAGRYPPSSTLCPSLGLGSARNPQQRVVGSFRQTGRLNRSAVRTVVEGRGVRVRSCLAVL